MKKLENKEETRKLVRALIEPDKVWVWVNVTFHSNLKPWYEEGLIRGDYWKNLNAAIQEEINGGGFALGNPCSIPLPPGTIKNLKKLLDILDESVAITGYRVRLG